MAALAGTKTAGAQETNGRRWRGKVGERVGESVGERAGGSVGERERTGKG